MNLPCCVESTANYRPKALYALRMLLMPLAIDPIWVDRAELGKAGLYYGPDTSSISSSVLRLDLSPDTQAYFAEGEPYPHARARWHKWDGATWPVLFTNEATGEPDLVASAFYWLSAWQEVTCVERDQHGRFPYAASLQAALGTATVPVVDAYREHLAGRLVQHGIRFERRKWGGAAWAMCPTYDVDYLRKWRKGMIYREVVHYLLCNHRSVPVGDRLRRFGRFLADWLRPADVYRSAFERLYLETKRQRGTATFFLKAGVHGSNDVSYPLDDVLLKRMLPRLQKDAFEIGLHPSYHAHTHPEYLAQEQARLATITPPVSVRQHFLRYEAPATLRMQERARFRIDSTLGFSECAGFRLATCFPVQCFDAQANRCTDVWEMPLAAMESALFNRRGLTLEEAMDESETLLQACKHFGGVAVMMWHNVLWDELDHPGWGHHFTETLESAAGQGAMVASLRHALSSWLQVEV